MNAPQQILLAGGSSGAAPPGPPDVVQTLTQAFGSSTTAHAVDMPAVVNAGDLLIVHMALAGNANFSASPAGWETIAPRFLQTTGFVGSAWFYRVADGSEDGATVDFATATATRAVSVLYHIQAGTFDPDAPLTLACMASGAATSADPPSLSTSWGAQDALIIAATSTDDEPGHSAFPGGYSGATSIQSNGGAGGTSGVEAGSAWKQITAASEDPGAFTLSASQEHLAMTLAIAGILATPLAAPEVVSATPSSGASSTSHLVSIPDVLDGDRLIVALGTSGTSVITTPGGGWNLLSTATQTCRMSLYYKNVTADAAATTVDFVSGSAATFAAVAWRIAGGTFDAGTAPEGTATPLGSTASPTTPVLTPTWGSDDTLWIPAIARASFGAPSSPSLEHISQHHRYQQPSTSNIQIRAADRVRRAAASEQVTVVYGSAVGTVGATIGVKPA